MTPIDSAIAALPTTLDVYDAAKARAMVAGYTLAWDDADVDVLAVEREFQLPFIDDLGLEHPEWLRGGKIDLVLRCRKHGRVTVVDHKTSGEDVSVGSTYRKRLILNGQASHYMHAARELLGVEPASFIFDVLCKPRLKPLEVTKTRKAPETPVEYERRILTEMSTEPGKYFAQIEITRSDAEIEWHTKAIAADAAVMDLVRARRLASPNDDACHKYGSPCPWWDVCTGTASLDDETRFRRRSHVHDELALPVPAGKRLLTHSRRQSFNACREKHRIEYEEGYAPVAENWNLMFGTAIHAALEAYWCARRDGAARAA
jgi:hypothetical protein